MKKIILAFVCVLSLFALGKCKRCNDKGYFESYFECPLCQGYYFISPAWFEQDIGNTRWTETTYFTGLQTKSDVRTKLFSFKRCPMCENSMKKGGVLTTYICSCEANIKMKSVVKQARNELKGMCRKLQLDVSSFDGYWEDVDDWTVINCYKYLKKCAARGKVLKKLAKETMTGKWDVEAAHYKRDESKYKNKVFTIHDNTYIREKNADVRWIDKEKNEKAKKDSDDKEQ